MKPSITFIFLLISCLASSQCPTQQAIEVIWEKLDIVDLKVLTHELKDCPYSEENIGWTYHRIGVSYYKKGSIDKAIEYTNLGVKHYRRSIENASLKCGKSFNNLGHFYKVKMNYDKAIKCLQNAIQIFKNNKDKKLELETYKILASLYKKQGNFNQAAKFYEIILNEENRFVDSLLSLDVTIDLADLLNAQKKYQLALDELNEMHSFLPKGTIKTRAIFYVNQGGSFFGLKKYKNAIASFKKAYPDLIKSKDYFSAAKTLNNIGLSYQYIGDLDNSLIWLEKGIKLAKKIESPHELAQAYDNMGEHFILKKDYHKALEYFEKAISTLSGIDDFPTFESLKSNPYKMYLITILEDYARAQELIYEKSKSQNNIQQAISGLSIADQLIDQIRKENLGVPGQFFWREKALPIYERAINICYTNNDPEAAYYFFEKSKSILLLEAMQKADAFQFLPDSIRMKYQRLSNELSNVQLKVEAVASPENLAKLLETEMELKQFKQVIKTTNPKIFTLVDKAEILPLETLKSKLSAANNLTAIQYFLGKDNSYALIWDDRKLRLHQFEDPKRLDIQIQQMLKYFENASAITNDPANFLLNSNHLYIDLIKELNIKANKKLIIIPDGILSYLSFDALSTKSASNLNDAKYLIQQNEILLDYSFTIFGNRFEKEPKSYTEDIVVFAPQPFVDSEVDAIKTMFPITLYETQAVTKEKFEQNLGNAKVLHISSHASSSQTEEKPNIALYKEPYYLSELYQQDIHADLVVLSACQTNIGQHKAGEGVMSLGRGFTYAGAGSLISSLWNVNATSTTNLLSSFYKNLKDGKSKVEALRNAKLNYLEDRTRPSYERSPYYWAGLVYLGDEHSVELESNPSSIKFGLAAIFFLVLGIGTYFFWRK